MELESAPKEALQNTVRRTSTCTGWLGGATTSGRCGAAVAWAMRPRSVWCSVASARCGDGPPQPPPLEPRAPHASPGPSPPSCSSWAPSSVGEDTGRGNSVRREVKRAVLLVCGGVRMEIRAHRSGRRQTARQTPPLSWWVLRRWRLVATCRQSRRRRPPFSEQGVVCSWATRRRRRAGQEVPASVLRTLHTCLVSKERRHPLCDGPKSV